MIATRVESGRQLFTVSTSRQTSGLNRMGDQRESNTALRIPSWDGGKIIPFVGRTRDYGILTIKSGAEHGFVRRAEDGSFEMIPQYYRLAEVVDDLYCRVYPGRAERNPDLTTKRILKSLSYPRTILQLVLYDGMPIGAGIFPRLDIHGEPVMYSTRFLLKDHEQEGSGTHIYERAIQLHQRESLRAHRRHLRNGMLMTQSWKSVRSLERLKEKGVIRLIQPLDQPYDHDGKDILFGVHAKVWVSSRAIDENGLSRGELKEVGRNETVEASEEGTRGWHINETMVQHPPYGAGMNAAAGDVIYYRVIYADLNPLMTEAALALTAK